jgi:transcriptional regulator with XRE-family HTH domain
MFSQRLKMARKTKRLTQSEFASRLGISTPTVSSWERGQSFPTVGVLVKIARELEVSLDYLVGLVEDPMETFRPVLPAGSIEDVIEILIASARWLSRYEASRASAIDLKELLDRSDAITWDGEEISKDELSEMGAFVTWRRKRRQIEGRE